MSAWFAQENQSGAGADWRERRQARSFAQENLAEKTSWTALLAVLVPYQPVGTPTWKAVIFVELSKCTPTQQK